MLKSLNFDNDKWLYLKEHFPVSKLFSVLAASSFTTIIPPFVFPFSILDGEELDIAHKMLSFGVSFPKRLSIYDKLQKKQMCLENRKFAMA
jgi:hypothetical protein